VLLDGRDEPGVAAAIAAVLVNEREKSGFETEVDPDGSHERR
jgi:hypothetical protein